MGVAESVTEAGFPVGLMAEASMSFQEALEQLSRDERFRATVYAMNTLLIQKGVYAPEEFEQMFTEWAKKERGTAEVANRAHLAASAL